MQLRGTDFNKSLLSKELAAGLETIGSSIWATLQLHNYNYFPIRGALTLQI